MPKDNEVDEKVTPVAWMTRKALENFAKHRSANGSVRYSETWKTVHCPHSKLFGIVEIDEDSAIC